MRGLFETLLKPSPRGVAGVDPFRPGSVLADGPKGEWTAKPLAPFDRYLDWLVAGLRRALPRDEPIELRSVDLPVSARADERNVFPEWDQDGGYLAATVSLLAPGTESRTTSPAAEGEWSELALAVDPVTSLGAAARGQKLLCFCVECFHRRRDVAPTVYRSAAVETDRRFFTVRFGRRR
jgi:hypothetical protein